MPLRDFLNRQKRLVRGIGILIKEDKKRGFPLSLRTKWRMWTRGFLPASFVLYNFAENDPRNYINDLKRVTKCTIINGENAILLDSKYLFAHLLKNEHRVSLPEFYIRKGKIVLFDTGAMVDFDYALGMLNNKQYIFKPSKNGGGTGIFFMDARPELWEIDGISYSRDDIKKLLERLDDYLIFKRIFQTGFAHRVYPDSLNTIRMLTMIDPHSGKVFLGAAYFRFGTDRSAPVDNMQRGGIGVNIDIQTGKLGRAATDPVSQKLDWVNKHPNTGFNFEGFFIPRWDQIKVEVLKLSQRLSFLPYIGWDIAPMEDDFIIIEGNSHSNFRGHQMFEPFLNTPEVKSFYKHYGIG